MIPSVYILILTAKRALYFFLLQSSLTVDHHELTNNTWRHRPNYHGKDAILEAGAAATQSFKPIKAICAHLNAFHVYASDPSRSVEANHYCTHLSSDVRLTASRPLSSNTTRLIGT
jgi:hypothetical protein